MAGKPAITKAEILDVAYARAQQDGLSGLSIRSVARECGVAVGTLYNYFPDKASLVSAIVLRFWGLVSKSCEGNFVAGESALDCCRALFTKLKALLSGFQVNWLREISMLDVQTLELIREDKLDVLDDIYGVLEHALLNDPGIDPSVFTRIDGRRPCTTVAPPRGITKHNQRIHTSTVQGAHGSLFEQPICPLCGCHRDAFVVARAHRAT